MKILVIGASSFTGRHFCKAAERSGAEVFRGSLRNFDWVREFDNLDPDYCVNFAALNVVAPSWDYPVNYVSTNVITQMILWDWLREHKPKKYVHVSTPEVYGNVFGRVTETQAFNPSTPYAVSRVAAEQMARCYHAQHGLPVVFTRACNVYGPDQQLYRLIPKLIVSIKKAIKFKLEGGGASKRAFIHVSDLCDATWKVMLEGEPPEAYHISTPFLWRIRDFVAYICTRMGVKYTDVVEVTEERPGKDAEYALDINKYRSLAYPWQDRVKIQDGIDEVIHWVESNWSTLQYQPMEYHIEL